MMRNKTEKGIAALLIGLLLSALLPLGAAAATSTFSVKAVIPDNQVNNRNTYFDLLVEPGLQQTLQVVVTNSSDREMTATVEVNGASTGINGLISYRQQDQSPADTAHPAIEDVARVARSRITVPAHDARTVSIDLDMPEKPLSGTLLGGVVISRERDDGDDTGADNGVSLTNKITYVVGLKLTGQDGPAEIEQDFTLGDIRAELYNYQPAVVFSLNNPVATIVKELELEAEVYEKNGAAPLHTLSLENAEMAPNSTGDFIIDWDARAINPGDYVLSLTARHGGRTWSWDQPFTIGNEAGDINGGAVGLERDTTWVYVLIGVLLLAAVAVIAFAYGRKKREE